MIAITIVNRVTIKEATMKEGNKLKERIRHRGFSPNESKIVDFLSQKPLEYYPPTEINAKIKIGLSNIGKVLKRLEKADIVEANDSSQNPNRPSKKYRLSHSYREESEKVKADVEKWQKRVSESSRGIV